MGWLATQSTLPPPPGSVPDRLYYTRSFKLHRGYSNSFNLSNALGSSAGVEWLGNALYTKFHCRLYILLQLWGKNSNWSEIQNLNGSWEKRGLAVHLRESSLRAASTLRCWNKFTIIWQFNYNFYFTPILPLSLLLLLFLLLVWLVNLLGYCDSVNNTNYELLNSFYSSQILKWMSQYV